MIVLFGLLSSLRMANAVVGAACSTSVSSSSKLAETGDLATLRSTLFTGTKTHFFRGLNVQSTSSLVPYNGYDWLTSKSGQSCSAACAGYGTGTFCTESGLQSILSSSLMTGLANSLNYNCPAMYVATFSFSPGHDGNYCYFDYTGNNADCSSANSAVIRFCSCSDIPPTTAPSCAPSAVPTGTPSVVPTMTPSAVLTVAPTAEPSDGPTHSPTLVPSLALTFVPTTIHTGSPTALDLVEFTAAQTIDGVDINTYKANQAVCNKTLQETISATLSGINPADITNLIVVSSTAAAAKSATRRLGSSHSRVHSAATTSTGGAIHAAYTVSVHDAALSYNILSAELEQAVTSGQFDTILATTATNNGAVGLENATSTAVTTTDLLPPDSPTATSTSNDDDPTALYIAIMVPAVLMMCIGLAMWKCRQPFAASLNQASGFPLYVAEWALLSGTCGFYLFLVTVRHSAVKMPVAFAFLCAAQGPLVVVWFANLYEMFRPMRGGGAHMFHFLYTPALKGSFLFVPFTSWHSLLIGISVLDPTVMQYLPWQRSTFTDSMLNYPNIVMLRRCVYSQLMSNVLQNLASILFLVATPTDVVDICFLVFSTVSTVQSILSVAMLVQADAAKDARVSMVQETELTTMRRLAERSMSNSSEGDGSKNGFGRFVRFASRRGGDINSEITNGSGRSNSSSSSRNPLSWLAEHTSSLGMGLGFWGNDAFNMRPSEMAADLEMRDATITGDVEMRNVLRNEELMKQKVDLLRKQLEGHGHKPVEVMDLMDMKGEISELTKQANSGEEYDTDRLDYLLLCLEMNPEYAREQEALLNMWKTSARAFLDESLATMRGFVPVDIHEASKDRLVAADGISAALARRLIQKQCLWLLRMDAAFIAKIHASDLQGRYNFEAQGLDLVETAALYAALPAVFTNDPTGGKEAWRKNLEKRVRALHDQHRRGALSAREQRNAVYKGQVGAHTHDPSMRRIEMASGADLFSGSNSSSRNVSVDIDSGRSFSTDSMGVTDFNIVHGRVSELISAMKNPLQGSGSSGSGGRYGERSISAARGGGGDDDEESGDPPPPVARGSVVDREITSVLNQIYSRARPPLAAAADQSSAQK